MALPLRRLLVICATRTHEEADDFLRHIAGLGRTLVRDIASAQPTEAMSSGHTLVRLYT